MSTKQKTTTGKSNPRVAELQERVEAADQARRQALADLSGLQKDFRRETGGLKNQISTIMREKNMIEKRRQELDAEAGMLRKKNAELQTHITNIEGKLQAETTALTKSIQQESKQRMGVEQRLAKVEARAKDLEQQKLDIAAELKSTLDQSAQFKAATETEEKRNNELEIMRNKLEVDLRDFRAKLEAVTNAKNTDRREFDQNIKSLTEQIMSLKAKIAEETRSKDQSLTTVRRLETVHNQLSTQKNELQTTVNSLRGKVNELNREVVELTALATREDRRADARRRAATGGALGATGSPAPKRTAQPAH